MKLSESKEGNKKTTHFKWIKISPLVEIENWKIKRAVCAFVQLTNFVICWGRFGGEEFPVPTYLWIRSEIVFLGYWYKRLLHEQPEWLFKLNSHSCELKHVFAFSWLLSTFLRNLVMALQPVQPVCAALN